MDIDVNYLAVLVAGIVAMGIGALWYSPILFGKLWMRLSGHTPESIDATKAKGMGVSYTIAFVLQLLVAYILAHFIALQNITSVSGALSLVFWAWLGFIFPVLANTALWDRKPWSLVALNSFHHLVTLAAAGVILILIG